MTALINAVKNIGTLFDGEEQAVGLVPTMGSLHAGHISLIKAAKNECKTVMVYIFVNPLQFGPSEDFKTYPRNLDKDLKICQDENVDIIFAPDEKEIYLTESSKKELIVPPKELTNVLCGKTRVGHFEGVATVVKKLFDIIQPDISFWGEKDLQQIYVIRWLVKEYKLSIIVQACPTIREVNGLACSSRNRYLSEVEKEVASNIYKALKLAKQNIKSGFFTVSRAILESLVFSSVQSVKVEYFEARNKDNLAKVEDTKTHDFYFLSACHINKVRLIDNIEL